MDYPAAERLDIVDTLHGRAVPDPYRWLEDASDPRTVEWNASQDELVRTHLEALPGRERLSRRMTELLAAGAISSPAWRGQRRFFMRRTAGQEHAVLLTVDPDGTERVLLDPIAVDPAGTTTLDAWQPDKEGRLLAYQMSTGGDEESSVRVMDVATGSLVDGPIDRARYSPIAWLPGGEAFYYVRRLPPEQLPAGEEQFHRRVWLHRIGENPDNDTLIFGDGLDKTNYYGVSVSLDGRWLLVSAAAGTAPRNDIWIADLSRTGPEHPELRAVQEGADAQTAASVGRDGRLYVFTDRDAPRGRLCVADPEAPEYGNWTELIPESPDAVLEGYTILDGEELENAVLVTVFTRHAVSELVPHHLSTGEPGTPVSLPGLGSIGGLSSRPEGGHEAWFGYTDHVTPNRVLHYDARSGSVEVYAEPPGSVDVPAISARQLTYTSKDGTSVRMFVLSPNAEPTQPRPTILYGYGGFGVPMTPGYSAALLAWVEAGGVYAIANLRGGAEEGEDWHRDGMRGAKQNVFDDFAAAAEELISAGWTTAAQLGISGGSNGGLLVGAALTQRPELYAAVVCSAPLLDMVRYEQFGLGQTWSDEYGTAADPEQLEWLLSYSPYHHVREGVAYPAVLFTVFDSDTRVDPLHARKMCAALQHATTSDRPVLIRRETDVGHGARSVSRTVALSVDTATFLAAQLGLDLAD